MAICEWIFLLIFVTTLNIVQGSFDYVVGISSPLPSSLLGNHIFSLFYRHFCPYSNPRPKKEAVN